MNQEQLKVKLEEFKGKAQEKWGKFKVNEWPIIEAKGKEVLGILKREVQKVITNFNNRDK